MRLLILALVMCTGCPVDGGSCNVDNECAADDVCARTHVCLAADAVRATRTRWTINGQPPDLSSCMTAFPGLVDATGHVGFQILFKLDLGETSDQNLGFAPVPCETGLFNIDKLPTVYTAVKLLTVGHDSLAMGAVFDSEGLATIDLVGP